MAAPFAGQVTATGSAQQIDASQQAGECVAFVIRAPKTNSGVVYIGGPTVTNSTGHQLDPGDDVRYERVQQNGMPEYRQRPADFYVWIVSGGDKVTWLAVR